MKKILLTLIVLAVASCGKGGGSDSGTVATNLTTQGGVAFQTNQAVTLCAGGAITIQNGTSLTWEQVRSYFGGFEQLRRMEQSGAIRITVVQPTYQGYPQNYGSYNGGYGNTITFDSLMSQSLQGQQGYPTYTQGGYQQPGYNQNQGGLPYWGQ